MWYVEIYDKCDFCKIVDRFVCNNESKANFWAGIKVNKLADNCKEEYSNFDYRIIKIDIVE